MKKREQILVPFHFDNYEFENAILLGESYPSCENYPFGWEHDLVNMLSYGLGNSLVERLENYIEEEE